MLAQVSLFEPTANLGPGIMEQCKFELFFFSTLNFR